MLKPAPFYKRGEVEEEEECDANPACTRWRTGSTESVLPPKPRSTWFLGPCRIATFAKKCTRSCLTVPIFWGPLCIHLYSDLYIHKTQTISPFIPRMQFDRVGHVRTIDLTCERIHLCCSASFFFSAGHPKSFSNHAHPSSRCSLWDYTSWNTRSLFRTNPPTHAHRRKKTSLTGM